MEVTDGELVVMVGSLGCGKSALLTPQINFVELLGSDSLVYGYLGADKRGVRLAARLHATSTQAHDGALPLRFEAQHMHLFDPASGLRLEA